MNEDPTTLFRARPEAYGAEYRAHVLEQYRLYVESAERTSSRRDRANRFFLTVNTALLAALGLSQPGGDAALVPAVSLPAMAAVGVGGLVLCSAWHALIRSYRDLNRAKFRVVHDIEAQLPLAVYDAEWEHLGRGHRPDLYRPFTRLEGLVPIVFAVLHAGAVGWAALASA